MRAPRSIVIVNRFAWCVLNGHNSLRSPCRSPQCSARLRAGLTPAPVDISLSNLDLLAAGPTKFLDHLAHDAFDSVTCVASLSPNAHSCCPFFGVRNMLGLNENIFGSGFLLAQVSSPRTCLASPRSHPVPSHDSTPRSSSYCSLPGMSQQENAPLSSAYGIHGYGPRLASGLNKCPIFPVSLARQCTNQPVLLPSITRIDQIPK